MENLLEEFRLCMEGQHYKVSTISHYLSAARRFMEWFQESTGEEIKPENVTTHDIEQYKGWLLTVRGLKPNTINQALKTIQVLCSIWQMIGHIKRDPSKSVEGVKHVRLPPRYLSSIELNRLLREAQKSDRGFIAARDYAVLQVFAQTGIRLTELATLTMDNVELSDRKGKITVHGKGGKFREVPLNATARAALREWLEVRPASYTEEGEVVAEVFISESRDPLGARAVQKQVKNYARAIGLEDVSCHTLRHTFAHRYLDETKDLSSLADLLGHSNLNATQIYTRRNLDDLSKDLERLK